MNKSELITAIAAQSGQTKVATEVVVNGFIDTVTSQLAAGEEVALVGFGTFKTAERAERQGRNPATGEAITIAASTAVTFKAGKTLKEAVNS